MNKWYVYVNSLTMHVFKVSPVKEEEESDCEIVEVDPELGLMLVNEPHRLHEFILRFEGAKLVLAKKGDTTVFMNFTYSPMLIKKYVAGEDHDILISASEGRLFVALRPALVPYALGLSTDMQLAPVCMKLYVVARNDPHYLLEEINVDLAAMAAKTVFDIPFIHQMKDVSFLTPKMFNSHAVVEQ